MMTCSNCNSGFEGKYCPECGQKAGFRKITVSMIISGLISSITNVDKGLWYNIKSLTLTPGNAIQGYLGGRWSTFLHPLKYAILGVTLMTVLSNAYHMETKNSNLEKFAQETPGIQEGYDMGYPYGKILKENQKFVWIANILFLAFPFALFQRRYSFAEWMTIHAFVIGHTAILFSLIFWIFPLPFLFNPILYLLMAFYYVIILRKHESTGMAILITWLSMTIGLTLFLLIPATLIWAYQNLLGL